MMMDIEEDLLLSLWKLRVKNHALILMAMAKLNSIVDKIN